MKIATITFLQLATVLLLLPISRVLSAENSSPLETEPFLYREGFEEATDPVRFWTSYKKKYTVNFKGITTEKARTGNRSFKLDVTFDEASRFLWQIPMPRKVPAAGDLRFLGYMLLGDDTTAKATLGVSFALPPSRHAGCTAWGTLARSTGGDWKEYQDELVSRGREKADLIIGINNWGVRGENVSPVVERIIVDVRAEAGERVVLYVDDLELRGNVPTDDVYRKETEAGWAPFQVRFETKISEWLADVQDAEKQLAGFRNLSPRAEEMRAELAGEIRATKDKIEAARSANEIRKQDQLDIDSSLESFRDASASVPALSKAEKAGRILLTYVVPPISGRMILPKQRCVPGIPSERITLAAARGEFEPASFVVSALTDIHSMSIAVSDLHNGESVIPGNQVDVKVVKCWYQAGTAWVGIRQDKSKRILTPELLLNDETLVKVDHKKQENYVKLATPDGERYVWISDPTDVTSAKSMPVDKFPVNDSPVLHPVEIPAGTNKQFWLTIRVPEDAAAGTYSGTVTLSNSATKLSELSLTVDVLPFELLPPYYTSSMDYHGRLDPSGKGTIGSWLKSRAQFRAELENMVAHGLRNCQHYSIPKEMLGEVLKIREDVGMDNRTLYLKNTIPIGNPSDPEALEAIQRDVREILNFTRGYGTEVVYFYGMDERRGEVLQSQRPAWTAVREAGGKIFVAGWGDNIDLMGDIQDMHVRAGWPNPEEVSRWHALGHKVFCYANPQTGVENPLVYRRNFGLLLWKYDYDGAATNAYQHTFGATWNDFDHTVFRSHTIAYPTVDGVIDTIAWEGYREAVDDVRYITTLEDAVRAGRESRDPARQKSAEAADDFLHQLKKGQTIETANLDEIRRRIVERILQLTETAVGDRQD